MVKIFQESSRFFIIYNFLPEDARFMWIRVDKHNWGSLSERMDTLFQTSDLIRLERVRPARAKGKTGDLNRMIIAEFVYCVGDFTSIVGRECPCVTRCRKVQTIFVTKRSKAAVHSGSAGYPARSNIDK